MKLTYHIVPLDCLALVQCGESGITVHPTKITVRGLPLPAGIESTDIGGTKRITARILQPGCKIGSRMRVTLYIQREV